MGLRHLPVTDVDNRVVGMLTRADLATESVRSRIAAAYRPEDIFAFTPGSGPRLGPTRALSPRLRGREQLLLRQAAALARSAALLRDGEGTADDGWGPAVGGGFQPAAPDTRDQARIAALRSAAAVAAGGGSGGWAGRESNGVDTWQHSDAARPARAVRTWQTRLDEALARRGRAV
jgi:hypothetical protein